MIRVAKLSIIRLLDEETFFIGAGLDHNLEKEQYIDVLNPRHSYKNLAQIEEVFDHYALCKKLGKRKIFFGDTVRIRPRQEERKAQS